MAKVITDENKIKWVLERGVDEIIEKEHLEEEIRSDRQLRVKLGIDPTAKDLHLGHAVVLRKLRQFQDLGHQAVLIIGDFTTLIGDPSGKSETRPELTKREIKKNMESYLKEAGKILDTNTLEVRYNSEWYGKKRMDFFMELASKFTIARVLERDDFQKRLKEDRDIGVLEILYPILQGYDSVEVKADIELGGTDQKFNLLMGRKVQKRYGIPSQDILTLPLIEGTDGVRKMSKSLGNYIGLSEKPTDMFNEVMAIPDDLMVKYFTLLTDVPDEEIKQAKLSPRNWKEKLAIEIVKIYHGEKEAREAKEEFEKVFSEGGIPQDIKELVLDTNKITLLDLLEKSNLVSSKSEAKRLVEEGGVQIDGVKKENWSEVIELKGGEILKVGPRRFRRLIT